MYVDVHAHMDSEVFSKNLDKIISKSKEDGIKAIISNGTSPISNRKVLELSKLYPLIKPALGMYPIEANEKEGINVKKEFIEFYDEKYKLKINELTDKDINFIFESNYKSYIEQELNFIKKFKDNIFAIGEVGIDLHWTKDTKYQKYAFEKIIELSNKIKKPLIVHSRDAENYTYKILKENNAQKVIQHCFSGSLEVASQMIDDGYYFTIPCNVIRSKKVQEFCKFIDINKILTETDAPYLAPMPKETNYPYNVILSVKKISEIKGLSEKDTMNNIYKNYQKILL